MVHKFDSKLKEILADTPSIIGIAPNAWSRVIANDFLPNYSIVCMKWRGETQDISQDCEVFSLEREDPNLKLQKANALEIIKVRSTQKYINSKKNPHLLIYKSSLGIEEIADFLGWHIIGTRSFIKDKFENKKYFREFLKESGIDPIPGESLRIENLNINNFIEFANKYSLPLVFQLSEMTAGGGTGTAFVKNFEEYENFLQKLKEKVLEKRKLPIENINVTKFINGISGSIAACVTENGVITTRMQTQIQDIAEVRSLEEGSGLFSGHDWSFRQYSDQIQDKARYIAKRFGEYIYKLGYRGIFGLDLLVDEKDNTVYPVECNPRYTDAFPVISMMHMEKGLLPLDVPHILENLGAHYEFDVEDLSSQYSGSPLEGSQIIIETKSKSWTKVGGEIKPGVYKRYNDNLIFLRKGYRFEHIISSEEFLVTEGVPFTGTILKPGARVLRLVFKKSILAEKNRLTEEAKNIIDRVYKELFLVNIEEPEEFAYGY